MICFCFLPESPRWLIQKGKYEEAYESLAKFRTNTVAREVESEFDSIKNNCLASQREEETNNIGRILRTPAVLRALFVGSMLMMFQQLAGINTVMYYSATIIQMSGVHDKSTAVWMSAATASVNFILSFVGLALVERLGRRLLILSSLFGVIFALLLLGVGFQLAENNSPSITFHTTNQSECSIATNCNQCLQSRCGFCYYEDNSQLTSPLTTQSSWLGLSKPDSNGTCLLVDSNDPLHAAGHTLCSNGSNPTTDLVWANNWCPSKYSWMTLAGLMLYLFFFAPGMILTITCKMLPKL